MRTLELLAPAKNLACGLAAIRYGADAVYIGAPRFGARAAAGNSLEDIRQLCQYAHLYGAKVHVTVNTIIYDHELEATLQMIGQLQEVGVDALLLQDMGVLSALKGRWDGELHASTQCDTRSSEKVAWLQSLGFHRAVLARELSATEIAAIHEAVPTMDLEVFVHGALCVSYSGVCYASQHCFQRSANRGECAQFCRLKFDLKDSDGKTVCRQRHLLSLKDMCQIDMLETLADAGACSFKIEGRLKDADYVKNVVSAYSQQLDALVASRPGDYRRASRGRVEYFFTPNLQKTFNRGFTHYFLNGRQPDIASFDTPKAMGEYVGKVKEIRGNSFNVAGMASFANGDGLCFINDNRELEGFRVNRAEGNRLFPQSMPRNLRPGTDLYRNNDEAFEKLLSGTTAERRLPVTMQLKADDAGFMLEVWTTDNKEDSVSAHIDFVPQEAKKPQGENMRRQLAKLGNTPFSCNEVQLQDGVDNYFMPSSLLSDLRRMATERLEQKIRQKGNRHSLRVTPQEADAAVKAWQPSYGRFSYLYNIANQQAASFYARHGMSRPAKAFELEPTHTADTLIMQCRHCLRYALGYCVKRGGKKPTWREPLFLELPDGKRFRLEFDCRECQMNIYTDKK